MFGISPTSLYSPGFLSCLVYSTFSIVMVLANKLVVSSFEFRATLVLLVFQNTCAVVMALAGRALTWLSFENFTLRTAVQWLPVNILFCLMLYTGFKSLQYLSVPLVTIFKNVTNIIILVGDWYFFKQPTSAPIVLSLMLMLAGAVMAGFADIAFSAVGYTWMALNCLATASYVLYLKRAVTTVSLSKFGMVYYNNLLSVPLLLGLALLNGELGSVWAQTMGPGTGSSPVALQANGAALGRAVLPGAPLWVANPLGFVGTMLVSGVVGFALNGASLWCVQATSPSTFSMVGALNKIPLAILGVMIFSDPLTLQLASFIMVSLAGGVLYSYVKERESQAAARSTLPK